MKEFSFWVTMRLMYIWRVLNRCAFICYFLKWDGVFLRVPNGDRPAVMLNCVNKLSRLCSTLSFLVNQKHVAQVCSYYSTSKPKASPKKNNMSGAYPYPLTKQTCQAFSYVQRQINSLNNLTHWLWTHPRFPPAHQLGFE